MASGSPGVTGIIDPAWSHITPLSLIALAAGAVIKSAERYALNKTWRAPSQKAASPDFSAPYPEIRLEPMLVALENWGTIERDKSIAAKRAARMGRWDRTTNVMAQPIVASVAHLATSASAVECLVTGFIAAIVCAVPSSDAKKYDGIHHQLIRTFLPGLAPAGALLLGMPASVAISLVGLLTGLVIATFPPRDPVSKAAKEADLYANARNELQTELGNFFLGQENYQSFGRYDAPVGSRAGTSQASQSSQAYLKWRDEPERKEKEEGRLRVLEGRFRQIEADLSNGLRGAK
ncbi:MAG TPA: hypothetical protein VFX30_01915 [bacterium]|nr:hypothetical protein [bacterium]